jgi:hypothetical protein
MDGEHERERRETEACLAGVEAAIDRMDSERVNATLDAVTRPLTEHLGTREMLKAVAEALFTGIAPFGERQ